MQSPSPMSKLCCSLRNSMPQQAAKQLCHRRQYKAAFPSSKQPLKWTHQKTVNQVPKQMEAESANCLSHLPHQKLCLRRHLGRLPFATRYTLTACLPEPCRNPVHQIALLQHDPALFVSLLFLLLSSGFPDLNFSCLCAKPAAVGFDIEWRVTYKPGEVRKTALMQLCYKLGNGQYSCLLLHIAHSGVTPSLKELLQNEVGLARQQIRLSSIVLVFFLHHANADSVQAYVCVLTFSVPPT